MLGCRDHRELLLKVSERAMEGGRRVEEAAPFAGAVLWWEDVSELVVKTCTVYEVLWGCCWNSQTGQFGARRSRAGGKPTFTWLTPCHSSSCRRLFQDSLHLHARLPRRAAKMQGAFVSALAARLRNRSSSKADPTPDTLCSSSPRYSTPMSTQPTATSASTRSRRCVTSLVLRRSSSPSWTAEADHSRLLRRIAFPRTGSPPWVLSTSSSLSNGASSYLPPHALPR